MYVDGRPQPTGNVQQLVGTSPQSSALSAAPGSLYLPQIHPQTSHSVDYIVHVCLGLVSYLLPMPAFHANQENCAHQRAQACIQYSLCTH